MFTIFFTVVLQVIKDDRLELNRLLLLQTFSLS